MEVVLVGEFVNGNLPEYDSFEPDEGDALKLWHLLIDHYMQNIDSLSLEALAKSMEDDPGETAVQPPIARPIARPITRVYSSRRVVTRTLTPCSQDSLAPEPEDDFGPVSVQAQIDVVEAIPCVPDSESATPPGSAQDVDEYAELGFTARRSAPPNV